METLSGNRTDLIRTVEEVKTKSDQLKELGRRNITNEQRLRLIGQMQENRKCKESFKGNQYTVKNGEVQNEPNQKPKSTAAQIAKEVGVSESTVKRAEKFSKGIDAIQSVSPEAAQKILKGGSGVTKAEVMNDRTALFSVLRSQGTP